MIYSFNVSTKIKELSMLDFKVQLETGFAGKKLALLISQNGIERFNLITALEKLKKIAQVIIITEIDPNPTELSVMRAMDMLGDYLPDTVIAIGGGSAIDTAKAIVALHNIYLEGGLSKDSIITLIKDKSYLNSKTDTKIIAVPTTAGTGSEVTSWATVWDSKGIEKYSVDAHWLSPIEAWIVPELMLTLPKRLTLATALDAVSHATEAYWSKKTNVVVRELSKTSISLISEFLPLLLKDLNNIYFRRKVCTGALFAGMAFANTRTTACHSISYPMTSLFNVEHGFAVSVTLYDIMRINAEGIVDFDGLLEAFGAKSLEEVQKWFLKVCEDIQPLKLSQFGLKREDIDVLVEHSFTDGRMDNNPVPLTKEQVRGVLDACF